MTVLGSIVEEMEKVSSELDTISSLRSAGEITHKFAGVDISGNWLVNTWHNPLQKHFTVGYFERVGRGKKPFPLHIHHQKSWIVCAAGETKLEYVDKEGVRLKAGDSVEIPPGTAYSLAPLTNKCIAVFLTVPSDPGFLEHDDTQP